MKMAPKPVVPPRAGGRHPLGGLERLPPLDPSPGPPLTTPARARYYNRGEVAAPAGDHLMRQSLRALLEGVIDYAGLFPPAKLPLEQAVRNYARYHSEPESWMLARFVCPEKQLADLNTRRRHLPETLNLSVLGTCLDFSGFAVY